MPDDILMWKDFGSERGWGLLLGNGFSMNISNKFSYQSLYDTAVKIASVKLNLGAQAVFGGDRHFESVIHSLSTSAQVARALGNEKFAAEVEEISKNVRASLVAAVHAIHPEAKVFREDKRLEQIGTQLLKYDSVFTTNYDLLPYWSAMEVDATKSTDYFFTKSMSGDNLFDPENGNERRERTEFLYLHGALHLYNESVDRCCKVVASRVDMEGLITKISEAILRGRAPAAVTDGSSSAKMKLIDSSSYLRFTRRRFQKFEGNLVVLGHGLDPAYDAHIVDVLKTFSSTQTVAIGIFGADSAAGREAPRVLQGRIPSGPKLSFFRTETHPLGVASLSLPKR